MSIDNFLMDELEKWQEESGIELVKLSDPGPVPIYDENGARIRKAELAPGIKEMLAEVVRRARLDPLFQADWRAALRKHSDVVSRERGLPFKAGSAGGRRKKRRWPKLRK